MQKILQFIDSLSCTKRWSQEHCLKEESVLEHTGFVAIYAYYICCKYNIRSPDVLQKSIVHDMEEVITGDIPFPTKYKNPQVLLQIRYLERDAASEISRNLFNNKMYPLWHSAKSLDSQSGRIIAIADCAAVVYKIQQEISLGNNKFKEFIPGVTRSIKELLSKIDDNFAEEAEILLNILKELSR